MRVGVDLLQGWGAPVHPHAAISKGQAKWLGIFHRGPCSTRFSRQNFVPWLVILGERNEDFLPWKVAQSGQRN
jgi:hypothetical protein